MDIRLNPFEIRVSFEPKCSELIMNEKLFSLK